MPTIEYLVVRGPKASPGFLALDGLSNENTPFTKDDFYETAHRGGAYGFASREEARSYAGRAGWKKYRLRKVTVLPPLGLDAEALRRLSLRCDEQALAADVDDEDEFKFWEYTGASLDVRAEALR